MKASENTAKHYSMNAKEWLVVFLIALVMHVLLLSFFVPAPHFFAETAEDKPHTLFLEEQNLDLRHHDPYKLQYWLRFSDPERFLKPDHDTGFSMFQGRNELSVPDPTGLSVNLYDAVSFYHEPIQPLPQERSAADLIPEPEIPVIRHLPERIAFTNVQYPLWTDENGKQFQGLFLTDEKSLRLLKQQNAYAPSVLRLTLQRGAVPEVRLLRSSGNPKLDNLAVRQLKIRKENFLPMDSAEPGIKYFTVFWQMPDLKSIRKEKRIMP